MKTWNPLIARIPGAHVLQTNEWGTIKARYGWQPYYLLWRRPAGSDEITFSHWSPPEHEEGSNPPDSVEVAAAALCLIRPVQLGGITLPLSIAYVPKGPLLNWGDGALRTRVLADLPRFAKKREALFLKIDPDVPLGVGEPGTPSAETNPIGISVQDDLRARGWVYSSEQIQFRNTVHINLTHDEDIPAGQNETKNPLQYPFGREKRGYRAGWRHGRSRDPLSALRRDGSPGWICYS